MQEGHTFNNNHLRHFIWGKDLPKKTPSKQALLLVRGMAQHVSLSYISINAKHRWQYLHYQTKGPIHPISPNRRFFFTTTCSLGLVQQHTYYPVMRREYCRSYMPLGFVFLLGEFFSDSKSMGFETHFSIHHHLGDVCFFCPSILCKSKTMK